MPIATKLELRAAAKRQLRNFSTIEQEFRGILQERRTYTEVTIFLSHCHADRDQIEPVVVFLRRLGIHVYVDWMDETMPRTTSGTTAAKIKRKIKQNHKFIFLATNRAIISRWCNWELGLGDAAKYIQNICLFPLADSSSDWKGNEYLSVYPRIEKKRTFYATQSYQPFRTEDWEVIYPDGSRMSLQAWLRR